MQQLRHWYGLGLLLLLILSGCSGTPAAAPQTADSVHQAWVFAIRDGDVEAARKVVDPELGNIGALLAQEKVSYIRDIMTTSGPLEVGKVQSIDLRPYAAGQAISVWNFEKKANMCWVTEMLERDGRWWVTQFGETGNC